MGKWFAKVYDPMMKPLEKNKFWRVREELLADAKGKVLEIGSGTGVNFSFYKNAEHVSAIEPNPAMVEKSLSKAREAKTPINVQVARAEELPFPDHSFDTVVGTLVFCTITDPVKAMHEIMRVLKPEGKVLVFEHVRLNDKPVLGKLQDALTPMWKYLCDGCHLNRNPIQMFENTGFSVGNVEYMYKGLFLSGELTKQKIY